MIERYPFILLDVDGVIVDSISYYVQLIREVAEALGADSEYKDEFYRKQLGVSFHEWMTKIVPMVNHHKMESMFNEKNKDNSEETVFNLFEGIHDTLNGFFNSGKKIGLVSTKSRMGMNMLLDSKKIREYIDFSISGDEVMNYKPDPEGINKAVSFFNAKRSEVVFVGDSLHDLGAARNAGISFIGVTTGVCSEQDWRNNNVNHVKSLCDLMLVN